jgi:hypothetical protein
MTKRAGVTQAQVSRMIKAALDAGLDVSRVEVDRDGKIIVFARKPSESIGGDQPNPWNEVLAGAD